MEDEREEVINRNFDRFSRLKPIRYRKRLESHSAPSSPTRNTVKQTPRKSKSHSDFRKLVGSLIGPAYQEIDIEDKELEWDDYNEQPSFVEPGTEEPLDIGLDIRDNSGNREDPALEINLPEISEGGIFENNEGGNPIETEEVTDVNRQIEEMAPNQENEQMGTDVDNILLLFGDLEMQKNALDSEDLESTEATQRDLDEIRDTTKEIRKLVNAYQAKHGRKTAEESKKMRERGAPKEEMSANLNTCQDIEQDDDSEEEVILCDPMSAISCSTKKRRRDSFVYDDQGQFPSGRKVWNGRSRATPNMFDRKPFKYIENC